MSGGTSLQTQGSDKLFHVSQFQIQPKYGTVAKTCVQWVMSHSGQNTTVLCRQTVITPGGWPAKGLCRKTLKITGDKWPHWREKHTQKHWCTCKHNFLAVIFGMYSVMHLKNGTISKQFNNDVDIQSIIFRCHSWHVGTLYTNVTLLITIYCKPTNSGTLYTNVTLLITIYCKPTNSSTSYTNVTIDRLALHGCIVASNTAERPRWALAK